MCLLRKITYGEFSEYIQEKKVQIEHAFSFVFVTFYANKQLTAAG